MKKFIVIAIVLIIIAAGAYFVFGTNKGSELINTLNLTKTKDKALFSVAVVGDVHQNFKVYDKIQADAESKGAEFIGILGDFTKVGGEKEYSQWQKHKGSIPQYFIKGPHDEASDSGEMFAKYIGKSFYSFDVEGTHFVVLDDADTKVGFSEEQLSWLETDLKLAQSSKLQAVLFMHIPPKFPFASPEEVGQKTKEAQDQAEKMLEIASRYAVSKIYTGHLHNYFEYMANGIPVVVTGGGGGPLHELPILGNKYGFHYVLVKVFQSGKIEQEIVKLGN